MPMIRVPVDAAWVRRMAELADGPWTAEAVEAAFRRYGWTGAFLPGLAWNEQVDLFGSDGDASGWTMQLYDPPPSEDDGDPGPMRGMALVCASYWPPLAFEDVWATDTGYHESDDWDAMRAFAEQGAAWTIEADARHPDFAAEFDRIHGLVRDILGVPTRVSRRAADTVWAVWDRGEAALTLIMEPNAIDYDTYEWLALQIVPTRWVEEFVGKWESVPDTR